jgi:hypothetical protein
LRGGKPGLGATIVWVRRACYYRERLLPQLTPDAVFSYVRSLTSLAALAFRLTIKQVVALGYWSLSFDNLRHGLARKVGPSDEGKVATLGLVSRVRQPLNEESVKLTVA